jgi:hypothetical protein
MTDNTVLFDNWACWQKCKKGELPWQLHDSYSRCTDPRACRRKFMTPGSPEAINQGCICAQMDNHHGKGYYGKDGVYLVTTGCPLHWSKEGKDGETPTGAGGI